MQLDRAAIHLPLSLQIYHLSQGQGTDQQTLTRFSSAS